MKISVNWLKNYASVEAPAKLSHLLNMAGLGVERESTLDGDTVFEVEVTPNRPDCLSYLGVAREVAASLNKTLKEPKLKTLKAIKQKANISIEDKKGCTRYLGAVVRNVSIKESPAWLKKNLNAISSRGINNVVDITNFCLMEQGQPLHAFDYDQLQGGKIIVRRARAGETIVTIDGIERKLDPSILVIADEKRPVAIAGIMGGKNTEVTDRTKNILLESAYFDPILIRAASRKLGLSSDSSYRFERGVNFERVKTGAQRALNLIQEAASGELQAFADQIVAAPQVSKKAIAVSEQLLQSSLGVKISISQAKSIMTRLGFKTSVKGKTLNVSPRLSRSDVKMPVDVIEEIARVVGYDRLPASLPHIQAQNVPVSGKRIFRKSLSQLLVSLGIDEIITYSLTSRKNLERTNLASIETVGIQNPLSQDQEILRPALLPSFLPVVAANLNRGQKDLGLFEMGKIYTRQGEKEVLGLLLTGQRLADWRKGREQEVDFFDIKGIVERISEKTELRISSAEKPIFEKGQSAILEAGDEMIGYLGKISQAVINNWDIRTKDIYFAQIDLEKLFKYRRKTKRFVGFPEYPAMVRDISIAVKENVTFQEIVTTIMQEGSPYLTYARSIEEYRGDKIPSGCRGLTISLTFRSSERTLREEEVTETFNRITALLVHRLGAIKR